VAQWGLYSKSDKLQLAAKKHKSCNSEIIFKITGCLCSIFLYQNMKKVILLISVLFSGIHVFSQTNYSSYIELTANVDMLGNIKIMPIDRKTNALSDTSINYKLINSIILRSEHAINTINLLANEGWLFVSAVTINKDQYGRPNTPYLAYYFRKQ
jgi:hypothetical protein